MKRTPLKRRSKKRAAQEREYAQRRQRYLEDHWRCQARACRDCRSWASEIHHQRGRVGARLLDERYWLAVCRPCHQWIEEHPAEARGRGWTLSRV